MRCATPLLAAIAFGLAACPSPPPPQPALPGIDAGAPGGPVWITKSFTRKAEGCEQVWTCDCSAVHAKAGCHLEAGMDSATTGACAADTGPVNGCTRCMALPPERGCTCNEVCR